MDDLTPQEAKEAAEQAKVRARASVVKATLDGNRAAAAMSSGKATVKTLRAAAERKPKK